MIQDAASSPLHPSPRLRFLVIGTFVSAAVGVPLLLGLGEISDRIGAVGMGAVGLLMVATGAVQLWRVRPDSDRKGSRGTRGNHEGCPYGPDARGAGGADGGGRAGGGVWRRVWLRCRGLAGRG